MTMLYVLTGVLTASVVSGAVLLIRERRKERVLARESEALRTEEKAVREKLYTDPLTGCRNDRAFHETRLARMNRKALADAPVFFAVFDSGGKKNSLKQVNDTYGYAAGDRYILDFRDAIRRAFPAEQFELFYGGASTFYLTGRGRYTEEQIYARFLELKRHWHDAPYEIAGKDAVFPCRSLQFAAIQLPDVESDNSRLDDLLFEEVTGNGKKAEDCCGFFICMSPGKILTNVADRGV